eukprot:TRINITY_DN2452_c0_g1_i1.p1 TRINITY_DN2452_c0_g1~~TRINITY_DN2452_c0_g1_i1.p1  ORF type:complete len:197 (-),score=43.05 TRINITY_DN2452_c0_g1_i1:85-675(-)
MGQSPIYGCDVIRQDRFHHEEVVQCSRLCESTGDKAMEFQYNGFDRCSLVEPAWLEPEEEGIGDESEAYRRPSCKSKGSKKPLLVAGSSRNAAPTGDACLQVTRLMAAAQYGSSEGIRRLCEEEGEDPDDRDCRGWTALHYAASQLHIETFGALLRVGANSQMRSYDGRTALQVAKEEDEFVAQKLEALLTGAQKV